MTEKQQGTRTPEDVENFIKAVCRGTPAEVIELAKANPSLVSAEDAAGRISVHFAAYAGRQDMIKALATVGGRDHVDHFDFDGNTPLVLAAKQRDLSVVRCILETLSPNVNIELREHRSVLHHAAAVDDNVAIIRLLIANGAKVNTEATECGSPLHWACHGSCVLNAAFFLDELKLPIDLRDAYGGTPLFIAVSLVRHDVVKFLLERGADVAVAVLDGTTPLSYTVVDAEKKDAEMVKLLCAFDFAAKYGAHSPCEDKAFRAEIDRPRLSPVERGERSLRFKTQGNTAFGASEFVKATRFYTLAISFDIKNHLLFGNRSACFFNVGQHRRALADARHCVSLNKTWPKGYFRVAAALLELGEFDECEAACKAGLAADPANDSIKSTLADLKKRQAKMFAIKSPSCPVPKDCVCKQMGDCPPPAVPDLQLSASVDKTMSSAQRSMNGISKGLLTTDREIVSIYNLLAAEKAAKR